MNIYQTINKIQIMVNETRRLQIIENEEVLNNRIKNLANILLTYRDEIINKKITVFPQCQYKVHYVQLY